MKFRIKHVHYMPGALEEGVLYVSTEFDTAAHLCACGCGSKIRTPLGPTEWTLEETNKGPSLYPSIGNWQKPCRSHYWITKGEVWWSDQWSDDEIDFGRRSEEERRRRHFEHKEVTRQSRWRAVLSWIKRLIN